MSFAIRGTYTISQGSVVPMRRLLTGRHLTSGLLVLCYIATLCFAADEEHTSSHDVAESSHEGSEAGGGSYGHTSEHTSDHTEHEKVYLFALNDGLTYNTVVYMICIISVFALIVEFTLEHIEKHLHHHDKRFYKSLLEKSVKELMIMGIGSFVIFMLDKGVGIKQGPLIETFKFVHAILFFMAITFILNTFLLGFGVSHIKDSWEAAAYTSKAKCLDDVRAVHQRNDNFLFKALHSLGLSTPSLHRPSKWLTDRRAVFAVEYHISRSVFIRQHRRAPDFDFGMYAAEITDRLILKLVDVNFITWLLLCVVLWVEAGQFQGRHHTNTGRVSLQGWFWLSVLLSLLGLLGLVVTKRGFRNMVVKLGAKDFDSMGDLLDKIWVVPQTSVMRRASMHSAKAVEMDDAPGLHQGVEEWPSIHAQDVFPFGSEKLVLRCLELLLTLYSYHLAFYMAYCIGLAAESKDTLVWIFVMPIPVLLGLVVSFARMLPLFSLLAATTTGNRTIMAEVEEAAENTERLRGQVVSKLRAAMEKALSRQQDREGDGDCKRAEAGEAAFCGEGGIGEDLVKTFFDMCDADGNGELTRQELRAGLLKHLGLQLSKRQEKELFRVADPDRSGSVDVEEMKLYLHDLEITPQEMLLRRQMSRQSSRGTLLTRRKSLRGALSFRTPSMAGVLETGTPMRAQV